MPELTVAIVEYHCLEEVAGCLDSLRAHLTGLPWEAVVVSNSEYSGKEADAARERLADARLIVSPRNAGYAGGVNLALAAATAPFFLLLNPDCRLTDGRVPALVDSMQSQPRVGVAGPRVVDANGEVQPSCRRFPKPYTFLLVRGPFRRFPFARRERRRYLMEDFDRDSEAEVDWLSGGAILVRMAALKDVGPMDERYFLYMEDVDWCRRFWQKGWAVQFNPASTVRHDGRHESITFSLRSLRSPHLRYHLTSLSKYFHKYGLDGARRPSA